VLGEGEEVVNVLTGKNIIQSPIMMPQAQEFLRQWVHLLLALVRSARRC